MNKIKTLPRIDRLKFYAAFITLAILTVLALKIPITDVIASTESDLRAETARIEDEIAANEQVLNSLEKQVDTLQNKISTLNTLIKQITSKIKLTKLEVAKLAVELKAAEKELTRQKGLLTENLRTLYIDGNVSALDLLLGSDSFSDYVTQQEYLESLKNSVQASTESVKKLKFEIEANKLSQEILLADQKAQEKDLQNNKKKQADLLSYTKGQESRYQTLVTNLEAERVKAEKDLKNFLASQVFKSLGAVNKGDFIGRMGSTGFSTGAHLHLGVFKNGDFVNPLAGGTTLISNYQWPTTSTRITTYYGASGCQYLGCGSSLVHTGLDIGALSAGVGGDPVYAAASGDIVFRGWYGGYGNLVIIDHGGAQTYYAHLLQ